MKRTIYDAGLGVKVDPVPVAATAKGEEGGKAITFISTDTAEILTFILPPEAWEEMKRQADGGDGPKVEVARSMPPFPPPAPPGHGARTGRGPSD